MSFLTEICSLSSLELQILHLSLWVADLLRWHKTSSVLLNLAKRQLKQEHCEEGGREGGRKKRIVGKERTRRVISQCSPGFYPIELSLADWILSFCQTSSLLSTPLSKSTTSIHLSSGHCFFPSIVFFIDNRTVTLSPNGIKRSAVFGLYFI